MSAERLPPGQVLTTKWPVLTYGPTPKVDLDKWRLRLLGEVESEVELTWEQFTAMPARTIDVDIHCVTGWSRMDNRWEGVAFRDLAALAGVKPEAEAVMAHSYGGYTTNILLSDLMQDNVMVAYRHDGQPLDIEHGGPARLLVPHLYFWKSAKWLNALQFLPRDKPGFWEVNGYHIRGDPWKEERYS